MQYIAHPIHYKKNKGLPMRESNKQRYLDAVRHIESREIPFQENIIDPVHKKAILGRDCISPA
ncbi:MAG: hypothetical protein JXA11_10610, partial [Phycisphaerae bacterium]|nr:hypothetical protein [Phycisphaerae bacterium]